MLAETGFNISETARRLGMHRRTLARKLGKQRVK
jgi:two-component system response regulator RegA